MVEPFYLIAASGAKGRAVAGKHRCKFFFNPGGAEWHWVVTMRSPGG
jgi:hypothetical protein